VDTGAGGDTTTPIEQAATVPETLSSATNTLYTTQSTTGIHTNNQGQHTDILIINNQRNGSNTLLNHQVVPADEQATRRWSDTTADTGKGHTHLSN
jgi:hypothetical protein